MPAVLNETELEAELRDLAGWAGDTSEVRRVIELPDFPTAIAVVGDVAEAAEEMDHHPDIDIRWRTLTFMCSTHSEGGVTEKDIALMHKIEQIVQSKVAPA